MQHTSQKEQPNSLSTTSPIHNTNITGDTLSPLSGHLPRIHKLSKSSLQLKESRVAAIQSAKREISVNIKEDWTWPPPIEQLGARFPRRRNSTQWQARESDSSPMSSRSPSPSSRDPYRFESPDAVLPSFISNRAKRRRLVQEESNWNEGLRTFIERRDFWTGAEPQPAISEQGRKQPENKKSHTHAPAFISTTPTESQTDTAYQKDASAAKALGPSDSDNSTLISTQSMDASASIFSSTLPSARTSQSSDLLSLQNASPDDPQPPGSTSAEDPPPTLVPLAPPLLSPADHPNIMEITPAIYPTLYSKCVVQNLAPSVPINLKHVVGSLVQGWKDDGEWPPKSAIVEKEAGGVGKRDGLREKIRGLRVDGEEVRLERVARRSVGKVKRALMR